MNIFKVIALAAPLVVGPLSAAAGISDWGVITDQSLLASSASMPAYLEGQAPAKDPRIVGQVWAAYCTFQDDRAAAQAATLAQLKARAALKGANAIVDVRYQMITARHSSCAYRGYSATGTAVVLN